MGNPIGSDDPATKGPVPFCLDLASQGTGAQTRLAQLRDAITALAGSGYIGLEEVFKTHLLPLGFPTPGQQNAIADHLKRHWFDPTSKEAYFDPKEKTTEKYAKGVIDAIEKSLAGKPDPVQLNTWWVVDNPQVKLLTLSEADDSGATVSGSVTLLILTPRPRDDGKGVTRVLGRAQAYVTDEAKDGSIVTRRLPNAQMPDTP